MGVTQSKPKDPQICIEITKDGKQCTRPVLKGEKYCWQHTRKRRNRRRWTVAIGGIVTLIVLYTTLFKNLYDLKSILLPSITPTSTPTFTATPSSTTTLTASPTIAPPASAFDYYMIVLDASKTMQESFHGRTKWSAALESLNLILQAFSSHSHYGLVIVGGANPSGPADLCGKPYQPTLNFDSLDNLRTQVSQLNFMGGGSYVNGYVLGQRLLEDLPVNTVKTLIYITGSSDACEERDEWSDMKKLLSLPNQVALYSEIIILDEDGLKSRTIAEQINSVSENVHVQAPQSNQELRETTTPNIVENVTQHVTTETEAISGGVPIEPANIPNIPAPTSTVIPTITNLPSPTAIAPSKTLTAVIPTLVIPSDTSTFLVPTAIPPTPTASSIPFACQSTRPRLSGGSFSGTVMINSPQPCSTDHVSGTPIDTRGTYNGIPQGKVIWVFVYPPNGPYYPQSPNACGAPGPNSPPPNQSGGNWDVPIYLGSLGDPQKTFDVVVAVTDQLASATIAQRLYQDCINNVYNGISADELSQMNIVEKDFITVRTR